MSQGRLGAKGLGRPNPDPDRRAIPAGRITLADQTSSFIVTTHCVDRFWERAAAGCAQFADALERLQQLSAQIGTLAERPDWLADVTADALVSLGPDVVLVIQNKRAITCLVRSGVSDAARQTRNAKRARRPRNEGRSGASVRRPQRRD